MTYSNQRDHALLDRRLIQPLLLELLSAVVCSGTRCKLTREEHLTRYGSSTAE